MTIEEVKGPLYPAIGVAKKKKKAPERMTMHGLEAPEPKRTRTAGGKWVVQVFSGDDGFGENPIRTIDAEHRPDAMEKLKGATTAGSGEWAKVKKIGR